MPTTCAAYAWLLVLVQASTSDTEGKGEWVAAFVGAAMLFGVGIWNTLGPVKAQEFFAGYLLEQSLSVDNLFVFILVFRYFKAPKADQDKVASVYACHDCCVVEGVWHYSLCSEPVLHDYSVMQYRLSCTAACNSACLLAFWHAHDLRLAGWVFP